MKNKGNILVVDDSPSTLELISSILSSDGYSVFWADSGELALLALEKRIPDLVLLDVRMPGISGYEVCKRLKQNELLKEIPVIFLTGATDVHDRIEGLRIGAVDYIMKPFEEEELLIRVKTHVELFTYHKLFKEKTLDEILENKRQLRKQNSELIELNKSLKTNLNEIQRLNEKHEKLNEELQAKNIELQQAKEKAEENERISIQLNQNKDQFISILAHDLKSPFNSLLGFLSLLLDNIQIYDKAKIEEHLRLCNQVIYNTYNLLVDILLWTKSQSGNLSFNPEKISLKTICEAQIKELNVSANAKNISLFYFETEDATVLSDIQMIRTVLRNLIWNAIKFTHINGKIRVYAEVEENEIVICVSDTGIGIEEHKLEQIWQQVQTPPAKGTGGEKGTGFGLLLCKNLVEQQGGKIWVESVVGKGSDFKFTVPRWV